MKDYRQTGQNEGFKLPRHTYGATVNRIAGYKDYVEKTKLYENKSEHLIEEGEVDDKILAEVYVNAIKSGLKYVPEDYRKAVFEHGVNMTPYDILEYRYHTSTRTLKRYYQRFVYGVAEALGDFTS